MNAYEQKQEARRERLENAADKLEAKAAAVLNVGQDHYSRDWAFITQPGHIPARAQWIKKQDRAFQETRDAADLRAKAASVGSGGVSSDDPDGADKLREQLIKAEKMQAAMKAANRIYRSKLGDDEKVAAIVALGVSEKTARKGLSPDFCGRIGFPNYAITNNGANIRRLKARIESLTALAATVEQPDKKHDCGNYRVIECFADNRLRVFFPGKPSEAIRTVLKSFGFRWSPEAGAWQRMLSGCSAEWLTREDGYMRQQLQRAGA